MTAEMVACPSCSGDALRRRRFETYRRLMAEARVPPLFAQMDFSTFPLTPEKREMVGTAAEWAREAKAGLWLYLWGPVGVGKTGLAIAALKARVEQGQPALFWSLPDLLMRIRATYGNGATDTEQQLMAALSDAELLVLDDLGTEKVTDWQQQVLFQIVNSRLLNQRETIITSNLPLERLAPQVGERTADRIESIALPIRVSGTNLRHGGAEGGRR